jgi:RHS repeat-associated protein
LNAKGQITRQYVYLANQPIAVIDTPDGSQLDNEEHSQLGQIAADIATAFKAWFSSTETIAYLHANHLGATELATDSNGAPIWRGDYSPYGKIVQASVSRAIGNTKEKANFKLNLRLPGQYEDEETGLYYNDHRYYDPNRGQYLTPDPLGLRGGINSYAYTANNPLKYIDPTGLILFAFDGTGNSDPAQPGGSISNVDKFYQAYD